MCKKVWIVYSLVAILLGGIAVRLGYIARSQPARVTSSQNRWTVTVADTRGTIYDTNLLPLVNETHEYRAALIPSERLLKHVGDATTTQRLEELRNQLAKGVPATVRLTKSVGFAEGMQLFSVPVRYSERLLAPHILGYLDAGGTSGLTGIEAAFNELLEQYSGHASASFGVDGRGGLLYGVSPESVDTTDNSVGGVVLTLDKDLQAITEDIASKYLTKGAVVVTQPYSGEILALASFPSFQPQTIAQSISEDNGALLNRALSLYDCGSVFKIITTAAALECGISVQKTFACDGYLEVDGTRFHCHNRLGHGMLDMSEAFAQSCNLYYIQLAQLIGADALLNMSEKFGLDESTALADSLSAPAALLPDISMIRSSRAALANLSFGQGYLMASPLHYSQIINTIINNGVMPSLTLIKGFLDEHRSYTSAEKGSSQEVISLTTAVILREMMVKTVTSGTGQAAAPNSCSAAGKTGTAETGQLIDGNRVVQSWFVGYFPAESPRYAVCVLAEDSTGTNAKATEVFNALAEEIFNQAK